MKILCVIDMQGDFINGTLGSKEAVSIVPNVVKKINEFKERGDLIITTQDTHYDDYLETFEGKKLPIKHCIANTDGWQIHNDIWNTLKNYNNTLNILKTTFGSVKLEQYLKNIIPVERNSQMNIEIEFVGLCLDICVLCNAIVLRTDFPNAYMCVDAKCTAATSLDNFKAATTVLESCQIEVLNK